MKFYTNNFPVLTFSSTTGEEKSIPAGTVFKVYCINGCMLLLRPVHKEGGLGDISVSPEMLKFAFTESDQI